MSVPRPIFGFLVPGERSRRVFSCKCPKTHFPILQNYPGGQVAIVEQSESHAVVENRGSKLTPFGIFFVTQGHIRTFQTIMQAASLLRNRGKK